MLGVAYLADTSLSFAFGFKADDVGGRGDGFAGGVLIQNFVGTDLWGMTFGFSNALRYRSPASLHTGVSHHADTGGLDVWSMGYEQYVPHLVEALAITIDKVEAQALMIERLAERIKVLEEGGL